MIAGIGRSIGGGGGGGSGGLPKPTDLVVTVDDAAETFDFTFTKALGATGSEYSLDGGSYVDLAGDEAEVDVAAAVGSHILRVRGYYADDVRGGIATRTFTVTAASGFTYLTPTAEDYFQPDGTSRYLQPA